MRVTHLSRYQSAVRHITGNLSDLAQTEEQISSGKRLTRASQDPSAMDQVLELRAALELRGQERRNADDGEALISNADQVLQSSVSMLQRANELAIRAANNTNAQDRDAISAELVQIRDSLVELANTKHQGRALFGGFSSGPAVTNVAGVWTYTGDDGVVTRRVGESENVAVNVRADAAFGFTGPKDVFTALDDLIAGLAANDLPAIETGIGDIQGSIDGTLESLAELGAAGRRIESARAESLDREVSLRSQLSNLEDTDLSEALMELSLNETAYQAAMAAFTRSNQASLVDFLR